MRRYAAANLRRECGTRTRLSQDVGVIGSFAQALLAGVRQSDDRPENLCLGVNLDDRSQDRFDQIERMPTRLAPEDVLLK